MIKRLAISAENKEILETVSGQSILLKNTFTSSGDAIGQLMAQAKENAQEYLNRKRLGQKMNIYQENNIQKALFELQETFKLTRLPKRIECFDISHLQGTYVYGSMVVFVNGKPAKRLYRLFKTKQQNNDFENIAEMIKRRIERALKHSAEAENPWRMPDLFVIDGGKGQLSSVISLFQEYSLKPEYQPLLGSTFIIALAKKEELVFVPGLPEPIQFNGVTKFLLQRLRDETHRFGITHNRNARLKLAKTTVLESIEGVGEITAQKLLREFGSVAHLVEILEENPAYVIEFVGEAVTLRLKTYFRVR